MYMQKEETKNIINKQYKKELHFQAKFCINNIKFSVAESL